LRSKILPLFLRRASDYCAPEVSIDGLDRSVYKPDRLPARAFPFAYTALDDLWMAVSSRTMTLDAGLNNARQATHDTSGFPARTWRNSSKALGTLLLGDALPVSSHFGIGHNSDRVPLLSCIAVLADPLFKPLSHSRKAPKNGIFLTSPPQNSLFPFCLRTRVSQDGPAMFLSFSEPFLLGMFTMDDLHLAVSFPHFVRFLLSHFLVFPLYFFVAGS